MKRLNRKEKIFVASVISGLSVLAVVLCAIIIRSDLPLWAKILLLG